MVPRALESRSVSRSNSEAARRGSECRGLTVGEPMVDVTRTESDRPSTVSQTRLSEPIGSSISTAGGEAVVASLPTADMLGTHAEYRLAAGRPACRRHSPPAAR